MWAFLPEKWILLFREKPIHKCSRQLYCNSQKLETTQMSFMRWIVKQIITQTIRKNKLLALYFCLSYSDLYLDFSFVYSVIKRFRYIYSNYYSQYYHLKNLPLSECFQVPPLSYIKFPTERFLSFPFIRSHGCICRFLHMPLRVFIITVWSHNIASWPGAFTSLLFFLIAILAVHGDLISHIHFRVSVSRSIINPARSLIETALNLHINCENLHKYCWVVPPVNKTHILI